MTLALPAHQAMREALTDGNQHPESPISLGGAEWPGDNNRHRIYLHRSPHIPAGKAKVEWSGTPYEGVFYETYEDTVPEDQVLDFIECEVLWGMKPDFLSITLPA